MRLFIAVEVGSDIQAAASRTIDDVKRRVEQSAPRAHVTWVKPENLHLTVQFIGEVDAAVGAAIKAALAPPLRVPSFDLTIHGTGTFPPRRSPRVIWAGLANGVEGLRSLAGEVRSRLRSVVPASDEREYQPHLTLGRVKNPAGLKSAAVLEGLEDVHFGRVHVEAVTLFESRLASKGPTYVALARTGLARS